MSLDQILQYLTALPWWFYLIAFFVIHIAIFAKTKDWEFEAKLTDPASNEIIGEVEVTKFKNEDPQLKFKLFHVQELLMGNVDIKVDENSICRFQVDTETYDYRHLEVPGLVKRPSLNRHKTERKHNWYNKIPLPPDFKTMNNERVTVEMDGELIASGVLLRD